MRDGNFRRRWRSQSFLRRKMGSTRL
jgi:hypothetical protein